MIRQATINDLPRLIQLAEEFADSTQFVKGFKPEYFINSWTQFLSTSIGVIFILDDYAGMLGAIKYPDINTGRLSALECFWFVSQDKRGNGLELLKEFELWAKDHQCLDIRMVHLSDSMPERLSVLYKRMGYKPVETHYAKEL